MTVQLQTLACPDCGAVLKRRVSECEYCGAGFFFSEESDPGHIGSPSLLPLALSFSAGHGHGFNNMITAGATVTLSICPPRRVLLERLAIASPRVRDYFEVNGVYCGGEKLLDGFGSFSGEAFHPHYEIHPRLRPLICERGMDVSLRVTNVTAAAMKFNAELYARVVPWQVNLRDGVLTTEEPKPESPF